jgi:hypothetical protein
VNGSSNRAQASTNASARSATSSSSWNGEGVMRSRSVPFCDRREIDRLNIDAVFAQQQVAGEVAFHRIPDHERSCSVLCDEPSAHELRLAGAPSTNARQRWQIDGKSKDIPDAASRFKKTQGFCTTVQLKTALMRPGDRETRQLCGELPCCSSL